MLELSQQWQQLLLQTMALHFLHVVARQANAFLEVHSASFIPRKTEHEHERENRKQAAAMTTLTAMDEDAILVHDKTLHQKQHHCAHTLNPIPTIEFALVVDVQPPPPATLCVRVIDIGAIDHAVGVMSCPMYGILVTAHEEATLVGSGVDAPRHRRNSRTPLRSPELKNAIQNARTPKPALAVAGWNPEQKWLQLCYLVLFIFLPTPPFPASPPTLPLPSASPPLLSHSHSALPILVFSFKCSRGLSKLLPRRRGGEGE